MRKLGKACLIILLILSNMFPTLEKAYANPFHTAPNNATHLSIRITEVLSNGVSVELFLENNALGPFLTEFKPESLKASVQNSTLLVNYDARVSESMLLNMMGMDEVGEDFQRDWLTYLQSVIILAAGLMLLAFEKMHHARGEDVLKIIEAGGAPPKGSWLSEKSLLLLSSRNPEAYRRALDMVLKGELRVKKGGLDRFRNAFLKLKKLAINRR